jgi:hypothetical protein
MIIIHFLLYRAAGNCLRLFAIPENKTTTHACTAACTPKAP